MVINNNLITSDSCSITSGDDEVTQCLLALPGNNKLEENHH